MPSGSVSGTGDEDDFFSNWDPVEAAGPRNTEKGSHPASNVSTSTAALPKPRTVTSTALKVTSAELVANATLRPGGKSPARPGTPATGGTRPAKLGAKKAAASINYEEAERKARAEEDHIKRSSRHTEGDIGATNTHAIAPPIHGVLSIASGAAAVASPAHVDTPADPQPSTGKYGTGQDPERLGIGFKRLGLGSANATSDAVPRQSVTSDDAPTTARDRFGNQKAISSEMFFERGAYDPAAVSEAKLKLAQFQDATSISSNQYFSREEEGEDDVGVSGSFTGNESLSALEASTRDALSRVMAKEEVQNALDSIRTGALKVSRYCQGALSGS